MANVPSSPILVPLVIKALRCSKTSILTRAPRLNIPEDGILHSSTGLRVVEEDGESDRLANLTCKLFELL
jgi:hypothetical protein